MKTGISRPTSSPSQATAMLEAAERFGFEGVQLKENQYRGDGVTADTLRHTYGPLTRLAAGGLIAYPGPDVRTWRSHLDPVFSIATELGADHVCLCAGIPRDTTGTPPYADVAAVLNAIGQTARAAGIRISLHNHADSLFETEADIEQMLKHLHPDYCGLTVDTAHTAKGGITDVAGLLRRFQDRVLNVHLKDLDADGRFCPLGTGILDMAPILATLREIGYDEWLIVDEESVHVPMEDAFRISRVFLDGHMGGPA